MDTTKDKDRKPSKENNSKPPVDTRKPTDPKTPVISAQDKLNRFLKESGIAIGTEKPVIDYTNKGQMIISAPLIFAAYINQIAKQSQAN